VWPISVAGISTVPSIWLTLCHRVFTGDSRPAMMARTSRRDSLEPPSSPPAATDDPSQARKSLLQFDSNGDLRAAQEGRNRISSSKSVFGVDQLWEKEMAKLKIIQEREEVVRIQKEAEEAVKEKRRKEKGKGKVIDPVTISPHRVERGLPTSISLPKISPIKRSSNVPPTLRYSPIKAAPPALPLLTENIPRQAAPSQLGVREWFGSSDEESDRAHERKRKIDKGKGKSIATNDMESDESEDNVPLSKVIPVIKHKSPDDEYGDVPLSSLAKSPGRRHVPPLIIDLSSPVVGGSGNRFGMSASHVRDNQLEICSGDDDDVPLALRQSRTPRAPVIEADLPLGYRHSHAAYRQILGAEQARMGNAWWNREQAHRASMSFSPYGMGQPPFRPQMWAPSPHMSYPYPGYPMMLPMEYPSMSFPAPGPMEYALPPVMPGPEAEKAIDSWRKEVAVAPIGCVGVSGGITTL